MYLVLHSINSMSVNHLLDMVLGAVLITIISTVPCPQTLSWMIGKQLSPGSFEEGITSPMEWEGEERFLEGRIYD